MSAHREVITVHGKIPKRIRTETEGVYKESRLNSLRLNINISGNIFSQNYDMFSKLEIEPNQLKRCSIVRRRKAFQVNRAAIQLGHHDSRHVLNVCDVFSLHASMKAMRFLIEEKSCGELEETGVTGLKLLQQKESCVCTKCVKIVLDISAILGIIPDIVTIESHDEKMTQNFVLTAPDEYGALYSPKVKFGESPLVYIPYTESTQCEDTLDFISKNPGTVRVGCALAGRTNGTVLFTRKRYLCTTYLVHASLHLMRTSPDESPSEIFHTSEDRSIDAVFYDGFDAKRYI